MNDDDIFDPDDEGKQDFREDLMAAAILANLVDRCHAKKRDLSEKIPPSAMDTVRMFPSK